MQSVQIIMGMPVKLEITDPWVTADVFEDIFSYFRAVDNRFSPFKKESEVSRLNRGEISMDQCSSSLKKVLRLCRITRQETNGYFDIRRGKKIDPCGLVKGWAIHNAARVLDERGFKNFYVEIGNDIEVRGHYAKGCPWKIGIRDPFMPDKVQIVKVLSLHNRGVATSGTYLRGNHIYNPITHMPASADIVSLTVIGPNVYEADRFATAAFAMKKGILFIERLKGFEGYMIDKNGIGTMTAGFEKYTLNKAYAKTHQ